MLPSTCLVVSYRNSTSNHNQRSSRRWRFSVVSYRNSTSNHNPRSPTLPRLMVVSYRNSTSNHNSGTSTPDSALLYLIEILHQTTTIPPYPVERRSCILSKFYIKPQPAIANVAAANGCILSKFYIKPQHFDFEKSINYSCILSKFYIKPQQLNWEKEVPVVVSYRNSTSNHNTW